MDNFGCLIYNFFFDKCVIALNYKNSKDFYEL